MKPQQNPTVLRSGKTLAQPAKPTNPAPVQPSDNNPTPTQQFKSRIPSPPLGRPITTTQQPTLTPHSSQQISEGGMNGKEITGPQQTASQAKNPEAPWSEASLKDDRRASETYLYRADDPDPPNQGIGKKEFGEHIKRLRDYSNAMFAAYTKTKNMREALLWHDFVTAFRPHTLRSWNRMMICEWKALFAQRGITLSQDRSRDQIETIIDLLYQTEYTKPNPITTNRSDQPTATDEHLQPNAKGQNPDKGEIGTHDRKATPHFSTYGAKPSTTVSFKNADDPEDPRSSGSDSSDDYVPKRPHGETSNRTQGTNNQPPAHTPTSEGNNFGTRPLGISGMIKAFANMPTYSGRFTEDLKEVIQAFETIADVCEVTDDASKRRAIPIMLKGTAFRKFADNKKDFDTYADAISALRSWFSSSEKQTRLLAEWNAMRLSEALEQKPEKSEIETFKDFVDRASSIQQQLHMSYHDDRQLSDMLLIAVDIPRIQDALRDRQPRTTHQLIERVATKLSHKSRSTSRAYLTATNTQQEEEAMYTLGQKYCGDARKGPYPSFKLET